MYIYKTLKNGIKVFAEEVPYAESLSLGVWVGNGSRHEKMSESGISHFIEHMVFKGTFNRSADDIAILMDSVGGHLNAFTTRECTCFYAKTLPECVETSMDILSDMVFEPRLSDKDMELERRVVLEEIAMYEDSPEDVVYDLFSEAIWGDTPMGKPILGREETLFSITPESMREYMKKHYTNKSLIIAAAGKISEDFFCKLEQYFGEREILDNEWNLKRRSIRLRGLSASGILSKSSLLLVLMVLIYMTMRYMNCSFSITFSAAECHQGYLEIFVRNTDLYIL